MSTPHRHYHIVSRTGKICLCHQGSPHLKTLLLQLSSSEVKERVELYYCSTSVTSWPVLAWTFTSVTPNWSPPTCPGSWALVIKAVHTRYQQATVQLVCTTTRNLLLTLTKMNLINLRNYKENPNDFRLSPVTSCSERETRRCTGTHHWHTILINVLRVSFRNRLYVKPTQVDTLRHKAIPWRYHSCVRDVLCKKFIRNLDISLRLSAKIKYNFDSLTPYTLRRTGHVMSNTWHSKRHTTQAAEAIWRRFKFSVTLCRVAMQIGYLPMFRKIVVSSYLGLFLMILRNVGNYLPVDTA